MAGPLGARRHRVLGVAGVCTLLVLIAAWTGPAVAAAGAGDPAVAALLAAGDSALVRLDLDAAMAAYLQAHRAAPQSYEAAWKLARALADQATLTAKAADQKRLCQQAESLARVAIALEPARAKGHAFLAVALGKLALFQGGKAKVRLSHVIEAEADTALALDADEDLAHHVLGVWNREVVELPGVLRFFATVLYGALPRASLEEALSHLRRAADLRSDVIPHRVELGITLATARRYTEAEKELERALSMPTSWVTDDYYRAKARAALTAVRRKMR